MTLMDMLIITIIGTLGSILIHHLIFLTMTKGYTNKKYSSLDGEKQFCLGLLSIAGAVIGGFAGWGFNYIIATYGLASILIPTSSISIISLYAGTSHIKRGIESGISRIKSITAHRTPPTLEQLGEMLKEYEEISREMENPKCLS